ncbi:SapC family protein [Budvicia diplopodorum]|uniref:SapC family protein n=1 Tax=Budvicia diplopodorum TaxID=1119056 RepID=UPI00135CE966|nr:SapC family protein [Budvicia diplopodorum]
MSKTMLLYKNVSALSRDNHKSLKLKPVEGLAVAAETHWMPVAGAEFYPSSHHYPIVFISEGEKGKEVITPILLLGLEVGRNDYMSKDFTWKANTYLPAFVRRYPFVIATQDTKSKDFTLCFDADFAGFNDKEGKALFNEDGTNSEFLNETIQFMNGFNVEMERTREFANLLNEYELLETRSADIRSSTGVPFQVQDFLLVSEEKLSKLTGKQLTTLNQKGYLGWIFAHLMSLANLPNLLDMHLANKKAK